MGKLINRDVAKRLKYQIDIELFYEEVVKNKDKNKLAEVCGNTPECYRGWLETIYLRYKSCKKNYERVSKELEILKQQKMDI